MVVARLVYAYSICSFGSLKQSYFSILGGFSSDLEIILSRMRLENEFFFLSEILSFNVVIFLTSIVVWQWVADTTFLRWSVSSSSSLILMSCGMMFSIPSMNQVPFFVRKSFWLGVFLIQCHDHRVRPPCVQNDLLEEHNVFFLILSTLSANQCEWRCCTRL